MDAASFERVYDSLQEFHAFFAASFGRKQWRDTGSGSESKQRELPSGAAGPGPGAAQRRESLGIGGHLGPGACRNAPPRHRYVDETVIGRLQEYLAPQAGTPSEAVSVFDGQRPPKQGRKSARSGLGSTVGRLVARWLAARVGGSWPTSATLGRALVDKPVSAQELDLRPGPVCCGGCAGGPAELPVKDSVGPGDAGAGPGVGRYLRAEWCCRPLRDVAGDDAGYRDCRRPSGRDWRPWGCPATCWIPGGTTVWPLDPADQSGISGVRPPPQTQAAALGSGNHGAAR